MYNSVTEGYSCHSQPITAASKGKDWKIKIWCVNITATTAFVGKKRKKKNISLQIERWGGCHQTDRLHFIYSCIRIHTVFWSWTIRNNRCWKRFVNSCIHNIVYMFRNDKNRWLSSKNLLKTFGIYMQEGATCNYVLKQIYACTQHTEGYVKDKRPLFAQSI